MSANEKREEKSLLDMLVEQDQTTHADTDDFIIKSRDLTPKEFNEAFEKKVAGHIGFSVSTRTLNSPMKRGA